MQVFSLPSGLFTRNLFSERRKEEDYDEEVEEDLQDEVCFILHGWLLF